MALRELAAAVSCQSRSLVCSQAPPCRETGRARHSYPEDLSTRTSIAHCFPPQFVTSCLLSEKKKMDMAGEAPMIATAMEFMARASSTSEVLTLNLTNLLILLVLKALIFGFGLFSVGGAGRSLDGPSVSQSELTGGMCFLMYTSGDESKFDCVQRTVCEDPYLASDYLTAAKMWYKMHNMLKS